jgi:hypothetical protein
LAPPVNLQTATNQTNKNNRSGLKLYF